MKLAKTEQADVKDGRSSLYHRYIKRRKVRLERRRANRDPECIPAYRVFRGWES